VPSARQSFVDSLRSAQRQNTYAPGVHTGDELPELPMTDPVSVPVPLEPEVPALVEPEEPEVPEVPEEPPLC
jgi:hypothetical protein